MLNLLGSQTQTDKATGTVFEPSLLGEVSKPGRQAGRHSNQYNVTVKYFCSFWLCAALYYYGRGVVGLRGSNGKRVMDPVERNGIKQTTKQQALIAGFQSIYVLFCLIIFLIKKSNKNV